MKKIYFLCFVCTAIFASCSNDGEEICQSNQFLGVCLDEYLDIKTYDLAEMSEEEFSVFCEAEKRMNVTIDENDELVTNCKSASDLNISDSLFAFILQICENSNNYTRQMNADVKLRRLIAPSNPEVTPNCALISVAHIKNNTKQYSEIEQYCDSVYTNWRNRGGLNASEISGLISFCGLPYQSVLPSSFLSNINYLIGEDTDVSLTFKNEEVVLLPGLLDAHCANMLAFSRKNGNSYLFVNDYQNNARNIQKQFSKARALYLDVITTK